MTDHRHRCPRRHLADEVHRVGVGADRVGVGDAARQYQPVVVVRVGRGGGAVDGEAVGRFEVMERLGLAGLRRDELGRAAGGFDGLPRLGELGLLDALVRHDERDAAALQFGGHVDLLGSGTGGVPVGRVRAVRRRRGPRRPTVRRTPRLRFGGRTSLCPGGDRRAASASGRCVTVPPPGPVGAVADHEGRTRIVRA